MTSFFTYSQAKYLYNIFEKLTDVGVVDITKVIKSKNVQDTSKHDYLDKFENNFLVYSLSPVKD